MSNEINIYDCPASPSREYKLAVYAAWLDGAKVQYKEGLAGWSDYCGDCNPTWRWFERSYRIDPTTKPKTLKRVPLTPDDLPPVFWVWSGEHDAPKALVTAVGPSSFYAGGTIAYTTAMRQGFQYSADRKTWLPFWKEVES